jgi:hypothetical protein
MELGSYIPQFIIHNFAYTYAVLAVNMVLISGPPKKSTIQ